MTRIITIGSIRCEALAGETILETAERHQIDMAFHCRDGFCGACRQRLICGDVEYSREPLAFIRHGDILTCCSYPVTDIELEQS